MKHEPAPLWTFALLAVALASPALAVDGVIEINQARALAGGVTASDTPGFPVTLDTAGSYRLTGNLDLSVAADPPNTNGIDVIASNVQIDLNGFEIAGTTLCSEPPTTTCTPTASGDAGRGIEASIYDSENVTVRNGTVRGMGGIGIALGDLGRVEGVRVLGNGFWGIYTGLAPIVRNSTVDTNNGNGIFAGLAAVLSGNSASNNAGNGIYANGYAVVVGNTAYQNGNIGITAVTSSSVKNNTTSKNAGAGIYVGANSTVTGNSANQNGSHGISAYGGSSVTNNTANGNTGNGILAAAGTRVTGNTVSGNTDHGLYLIGTGANLPSYSGNSISANLGGTVTGGVETGTNLCNGTTTCP